MKYWCELACAGKAFLWKLNIWMKIWRNDEERVSITDSEDSKAQVERK